MLKKALTAILRSDDFYKTLWDGITIRTSASADRVYITVDDVPIKLGLEILKIALEPRRLYLLEDGLHVLPEGKSLSEAAAVIEAHGGTIAVKAATYPGITSYGGNFEIGQDAVKLSISSTDENLDPSQAKLRLHFRELLRKRSAGSQFGALAERGEALDLLILLCIRT